MKNIPKFEGLYSVSKKGKIWSHLKKKGWLKPSLHSKGYLVVTLHNKNKKINKLLHRLVAITYINNPYKYSQVNHKNGIKTDNRIENLEWCTNAQNIMHSHRKGLHEGQKRDRKGRFTHSL